MKALPTIITAAIVLTLEACTPKAASPVLSGLPDRDSKLAHKLVENGALLLDVRSAGEFDKGHLDSAVLVPHDQLEGRLEEVAKQVTGKAHPIVVYCRSGRRSGIAKEILLKAGYTQVTNLGGMSDW